jgi:hypothetical protein
MGDLILLLLLLAGRRSGLYNYPNIVTSTSSANLYTLFSDFTAIDETFGH